MCEEDEIIMRLRASRTDGEMHFDVNWGGLNTALYEDEDDVPASRGRADIWSSRCSLRRGDDARSPTLQK